MEIFKLSQYGVSLLEHFRSSVQVRNQPSVERLRFNHWSCELRSAIVVKSLGEFRNGALWRWLVMHYINCRSFKKGVESWKGFAALPAMEVE